MLKKILVPLDRSSLAERVLDHLAWLAPVDTAEIILVSVVEPWQYVYNSADYSPPEMVNYIRESTQAYLEKQQALLRQKGYNVTAHVIEGDPAQTILEMAAAESVDLIAMSTHGRSGFVRWALGSVAERVIHDTTRPIFLVRANTLIPEDERRDILVPLDGSELSEQALPVAQQIAGATGARLLLLRVLDTTDAEGLAMFFESRAAVEELVAQWRSEAETYLEQIAQRISATGVTVESRIVTGQPETIICDIANLEGIDLIAMCTHGRSGLGRWVYGSTANKVLRMADCALLLVRATKVGSGDAQASAQSEVPQMWQ